MTAKEVIEGAIKVFDEKGWVQGFTAIDAQGNRAVAHGPKAERLCMYGAMIRAAGLKNDFKGVSEALAMVGLCTDGSPIVFNDKPGRTKEEVVAALRCALNDK